MEVLVEIRIISRNMEARCRGCAIFQGVENSLVKEITVLIQIFCYQKRRIITKRFFSFELPKARQKILITQV